MQIFLTENREPYQLDMLGDDDNKCIAHNSFIFSNIMFYTRSL